LRLPGGEYVFIGRTDHQIKVLGHRVELGEIEAALRRNPRVSQAVAIGWPIEHGSARGVVAFVSGQDIDPEQLRSEAAALLPAYMAPWEVIVEDEMPLNPNGKVDRNALRQLLETASAGDNPRRRETSI
jgi:acyl-coenzyme A synthetase/AMP-(fatty) acid ligase